MFKPMLAATLKDINDIKYPCYCTPKLDGIRCLLLNGKAVSRTLKPIPNDYIRKILDFKGCGLCADFDGELITGDTFNETASDVMTKTGTPSFEYYIFDLPNYPITYLKRMTILNKLYFPPCVSKVFPVEISTPQALLGYEQGYEGIIIRNDSDYKCGRSTVREGGMLKLKRFKDSEATIIGFEPLYHNANEAEKDAFGRTKRSSHKANKIALEAIGAFIVKDFKNNVTFKVATGLTQKQRLLYWASRHALIGKILKYRYQEIAKNKPRFPSFIGFREEEDM